MMNDERTNIRGSAVQTISKILRRGSDEQSEFVVKEGCIPLLLDLLAIATDAETVTGVLKVIKHVR